MKNIITCMVLNQWLNEGRDFILLDVLLPECYGSRHIPGATNACVYEMDFLDQVRKVIVDKKKCIVVYDSSDRSMASTWAARKLTEAGFQEVWELSGGMDEWEGSGYPVDVLGPELEEETVLTDGLHKVDCSQSRLEWIGRNVGRRHHGTIDIKEGEIRIANGKLAGGALCLDMGSIKNTDLQDNVLNSLLIRHLSSDDFFDVKNYPTAKFEIAECSTIEDATPGSPNYSIRGTLTIKDVSREIQIKASVAPGEKSCVMAHSFFDIDRTLWNVSYGSGKLFEKLGMHLVDDTISLELFLTAL